MRSRRAALVAVLTAAIAATAPSAHALHGFLDPGYGATGTFSFDLGPRHAQITDSVAAPGGGTIVVGWGERSAGSPNNRDAFAAKLRPSGGLDPAFNPGGMTPGLRWLPMAPGSGDDEAAAVALRGDEIVITGYLDPGGSDIADVFVIVIELDGDPTTFAGDGEETYSTTTATERATDVAVQQDGAIVLALFAAGRDFASMRIRKEGGLDGTYNAGGAWPGLQEVDFGAGNATAETVAIRPNGRIVLGGTTPVGGDTNAAAAQLLPSGLLDTAGFGAGTGKVTAGEPGRRERISAAGLTPSGEAILVGDSLDTNGVLHLDVLAWQLSVVGATMQLARAPFIGGDGTRFATATDVKLADDGNAYLSGAAFRCASAGCQDFSLARFGPGIGFDPGFGEQGHKVVDVRGNNDGASSLSVIGDKAVLTGVAFNGTREVPAAAAIRVGAHGAHGAQDGGLAATRTIDNYNIDLQAWIPQEVVADPRQGGSVPWTRGLMGGDCYAPRTPIASLREVEPLIGGDRHDTFHGGDARVLVNTVFDWDGEQILNFRQRVEYGRSLRYLEYLVDTGEMRAWERQRCVSEVATARAKAGARVVGKTAVDSEIDSAIPVAPGSAPINAKLTSVPFGTPPSSRVNLVYDVDTFPSHGIRVYRNGLLELTDVVNDLSCFRPLQLRGESGAVRIRIGLRDQSNEGVSVTPGDVSIAERRRPSPLCSSDYVNLRIYEFAEADRRARARGAQASAVRVAPVDARGRRGASMGLAQAAAAGLVDQRRDGSAMTLVSDPRRPVAVTVRGRRPAIAVGAVDGKPRRMYVGRGDLVLETGARLKVTSRGRAVKAAAADRTAPRTTVSVRRRGTRALLRFRTRDRSPIARLDVTLDGRRVRVTRGVARVTANRVARVRFRAVDVLGNAERLRRP